MDAMQQKLLEAAIRLGVSMQPPGHVIDTVAVPASAEMTPASAQPVSLSSEPVDPPEMKPEWEKEIDDTIAKNGGRMEITLQAGTKIRIVADPKPATDAVEVGYDTFKRLSRAAAILNARVVNIIPKDQADAKAAKMVEEGKGFWATKHVFIEVDKGNMGGTTQPNFGVVAAPKQPPSAPAVIPNLWLVLSAASITDQVPMRVTGGKVIGTLIKTSNGNLYARKVSDTEHRLNIRVDWAMSGGYTIESEIYDKYLTDPSTVIKFIRHDRIYLTNSAWIQRYGGVIKHWGTDRIVMPLSGNYWMVVDANGEIVK